MLVVDASDSALELMQGGEMPVISIHISVHISVQSRLFLLNRASDDMKNQSAVITWTSNAQASNCWSSLIPNISQYYNIIMIISYP